MNKLSAVLLLIGSVAPLFTFSQNTLFSESFEGFHNWQVAGASSPNNWIVFTCAGNGISQPGTACAYITPGGATPGCSAGQSEYYGYANAPSATSDVILYKEVHNSCYTGLQISFDVQIDGNSGEDYLELVYSTDNGVTWLAAAAEIVATPGWQTLNVALPATLDNTDFRIGFRFTCDAAAIYGNPAAIDNVLLQGSTTDATPPSASCPATFNIYADASCEAIVPDLPPSVVASDNCTATADLMITQSPPIGSTATSGGTATITVTDQAGLQTTCTTSLIFVDTIRPVLTCPGTQSDAADAACSLLLTDMTGLLAATDNCTSSGSLVFSQAPAAGTSLTIGNHLISLYAEDASGNTGTCSFILTVNDTTAPAVTCPPYHLIPGNALCIAHVDDLSSVPTSINDNCTSNPSLFSFSQVPAELMAFSDTIPATIYVSDADGNIGSCSLFLVAADTVPPAVTCLSDSVVTMTNPCDYTIPDLSAAYTANDICPEQGLLSFSQSPAAGTPSSGITVVTTIITDAYGYEGYCYTNILPDDQILPAITCPSAQNINNGSNCNFTLPDYTSLAGVSDNCSGYILAQSPPEGMIVSSGTNLVTLTVTDAGENTASCSFNVTVIENTPPSITCPANITSCDTIVSYPAPSGTDNCLFQVLQTDNSGLTSGSSFPEGITTQTYTIIDSSGNTASCSFTIEVLEIPDEAVIPVDTIELCNLFNSLVDANPVSSGTGGWSIVQGGGTFNDASQASTFVTGLSLGTNKLVWTVNSASCGSKKDTLIIAVWPLPSQAEVQDSLLVCSEAGILFQATVPAFGTGTWSNTTGIQFDDPHAPITAISNLNGGNHTVIWTVSSGTCPSDSDTMFVVSPAIAKISWPDTTICVADMPLAISGSVPVANQTPIWNTLTGGASFTNVYSFETTLTAASVGTVQLTYWLTHPVCGISKDTIVLTVQDCENTITGIPTLFTPNGDNKNDVFDIPQLAINYPGCRVEIYNRWGGLVFESDGYVNAWDGTYKGEPVQMGTYFYTIRLNDAQSTVLDGSISIIR